MSFLPRISRCPASQLLHGVLNTTVSYSLGQSVSKSSAAVFVCRRHLSLLPSSSNLLIKRNNLFHHDVYQQPCLRTIGSRIDEATRYAHVLSRSGLPISLQRWFSAGSSCHSNDLPTIVKITEFNKKGEYVSKAVKRSELLLKHELHPRDVRFKAVSSLYMRGSGIILKLQHIKAILRADSLVLIDSDHPSIQEFIPELQKMLAALGDDPLPFEHRALDVLWQKMFMVLDERLEGIQPALTAVLNNILTPHVFFVDRGEPYILLIHNKKLTEFHSLVEDIEKTLEEILESDEDMAAMYLTHKITTGMERDEGDIDDVYNILESYALQAESIMSDIRKLQELIDQSHTIIQMNLDSQRNIMLRLSLQLSMGMFSATVAGLIGMAFGMNLDSSLEEVPYVFWVVTGVMILFCGLLWGRLLRFLGKNLEQPRSPRITKQR